ncbi:hypothetical protein AVL56_02665 [Alteromonas stellipolaris]|nr:hypothetical protein AVL56_02665 [Alteromonas stellipolaris]ANB22214.1 hypothetical protein A6K25_13560 [Alteromonas stellipolaris]
MVQNKYGKIAIVALVISSALSTLVLVGTLKFFSNYENTDPLLVTMTLLVLIVIFINLFIAFKVYKGNFKGIKIAFWIYVLQILSIKTLSFSFYLSLGFTLLVSWSIGSITLTFNLFAIFMSVLLYKVMSSVRGT